MKKAIITMCTRKKYDLQKVPSLQLYATQPFFCLRKYKKLYDFKLYIISAKYGLIKDTDIVSNYEQLMDDEIAEQIKKKQGEEIKKIIEENDMTFLFLSKLYLKTIPSDINKDKVIFMEKGLLYSLTKLKAFAES